MKRMLLVILISLFSWTSVAALPYSSLVDDQKKDEHQKKKDPPGPPVVKDKHDKRKDPPPKKDKKPD